MGGTFNTVEPVRYWAHKILPLVYDDSLSYLELLGKVVANLNELIENNNSIPDYVQSLIKEYITSGEIDKVIREVIAKDVINVKNPPANLKPASGDGSEDDTEAIQGCIDYAHNNGGGMVWFPNGTYLTSNLTMYDNIALKGNGRYTTRVVLKGGVRTPFIGGTLDGVSVCDIGFDGNADIQVNNVDIFDVKVSNALFSNLFITDGYKLMRITENGGNVQVNNVVFDKAVVTAMETVKGATLSIITADNIIVNQISILNGVSAVTIGTDNGMYDNVISVASVDKGIIITGSGNKITANVINAKTTYTDSGANNDVEVVGVSKKYTVSGDIVETIGGDKAVEVAGDTSETVGGKKSVGVAGDSEESVIGSKTTNVTKNSTATVGGNYTETVEGSVNETVRGGKTVKVTGVSEETVIGDKVVTATSSTESLSGDKIVEAVYEEHKADTFKVTGNTFKVTGNTFEINTTEPIKYNKVPVDIDERFKSLPITCGDGNLYNVLVEGGSLGKQIGVPWVDIKDFGAVGDSVTDDTEAFKRAIAYMQANVIAIYISPGDYRITKRLTIDTTSGVRRFFQMFGANNIKSILRNDVGDFLFDFRMPDDTTMQQFVMANLTIIGNKDGCSGLNFRRNQKAYMSNIIFRNLIVGVRAELMWTVTMERCEFREKNLSGNGYNLEMNSQCNAWVLNRCAFGLPHDSTEFNVSISNSLSNVSFIGCLFEGGGGVRLGIGAGDFQTNIVFVGCYFEWMNKSCLHSAARVDGIRGVSLIGCYFNAWEQTTEGYAIESAFIDGLVVIGCHCTRYKTAIINQSNYILKNYLVSANTTDSDEIVQMDSVGHTEKASFEAPTTGKHTHGEVVWAAQPTPTLHGWICTASGTPGTWVQFPPVATPAAE